MKKLFSLILVCPLLAWGHGVHETGQVQSQKGGVIQSLETIHVELVQVKNDLRVYIFDKDHFKIQDPQKYPARAQVIVPGKKAPEKLNLKKQDDYWWAQFDAKGLHRYTFEFIVEQGGHVDHVKFTVEPKH